MSAHLFVTLVRAADVLVFSVAGMLATAVCRSFASPPAATAAVSGTLIATFVATFALNQLGGYSLTRLRSATRRVRAIIPAVLVGGALAMGWLALEPLSAPSIWLWPLSWVVIGGCLTGAVAAATTRSAQDMIHPARIAKQVAVVGVNPFSEGFIGRVQGDQRQEARFVGLYDDGVSGGREPSAVPVIGSLDDLIARTRRETIDAIVLALPAADMQRIDSVRAALRCVTADIYLANEVLELTCKAAQVDRIGPNPVLKIGSRPLTEWEALQKGMFDWVVSVTLLVLCLPAFALIAVAIKLDSPGPVLFRQPRLGFNNNMFSVFKFRTMYHHMRDMKADRQTTRNDPRITRVGRILRKTSLDEVPQLLNVLRGEMSLVGPRPHAPNTKAGDVLFHDAVADYALRHRVKPGITGWAQVNGWRGETRTREHIEHRVAHDLHYIDNWSLALDLKIMVLTASRELNSKVAF